MLPVVSLLTVLAVAACGQTAAPTGPGTAANNPGTTGVTSPSVTSPSGTTGAGTTAPTTGGGSPNAGGTSAPSATGAEMPVVRTVKVGDLTLTASLGVGFSTEPPGDGIRRRAGMAVEYTIANAGQQSLAVFDRVPDDLGSAVLTDINPEHAWVYPEAGVVRVSKQAFGIAPGVNFAAAPVTGIRALPAGATLTGRAWAPTPPALDLPGPEFATPKGTLGAGLNTWQFCVQVGDYAARGGPATDTDAPTAAPVRAPTDAELLCTDPTPLLIP